VRNHQSFQAATAPVGTSAWEASASKLPPADDDASLLALEMQFNSLVAELFASRRTIGGLTARPSQTPFPEKGSQAPFETASESEADTNEVESILARLYPIEQGIMQTPARTIAGLAVKARHAAYVMSQYWEASIDRIDWDARTVCDFYGRHCGVHYSLGGCRLCSGSPYPEKH
jgi:hypothetical protein